MVKVAKTYNDLRDEMEKLVKQGKAPHGAVVPLSINRDRLFELDVDDEIWQDMGLDDEDGPVPRWLCDEAVRKGIRAMLEKDRCEEEENRLQRERCAMQEWLYEEWTTVRKAQHKAGTVVFIACLIVR